MGILIIVYNMASLITASVALMVTAQRKKQLILMIHTIGFGLRMQRSLVRINIMEAGGCVDL